MSEKPTYPTIDPAKLVANEWNTNKCSPEAEKRIRSSLKRFQKAGVVGGMFKPIVVRELADGQLQILGGQHRTEQAIGLKIKAIPFHNLGRIDDKTAKEIGLADNARYGEDDILGLAKLLGDLGGPSELDFLPFSDDEYKSIFASTDIDLDDLELPDDENQTPPPPTIRAPQTHVLMRFKVPVADVATISDLIERTMKEQKFTEEDSLSNAGNALVHIMKGA